MEAPPAEKGGAGLDMTLVPPAPMSLSKQRTSEAFRHSGASRGGEVTLEALHGETVQAASTPTLNHVHMV